MADIAIFRINYKSDFILTLQSDAGWATPFCIKFWTGAPSQAYFVGYDGETYTHCAVDGSDPTKLAVQFDDHHLPIGDLKFQIGYHFTVADFPTTVEDEVINQAAVIIDQDGTPAQVMLDLNGETAPEIQFSLPVYANEAQRIANEEQRIAHEQQRIADEQTRIGNEETRINHEQTRLDNEAQRIRNEQTRINQEEARVREFATLKRDAQEATTAANDAAALANQKAQLAADKAQLAADKAALAQDAANLANQKAQLAADKAALAQDATDLANQKAQLAQQKAEYAQSQGDYAKQQGDYAKEQGDYAKRKGDDAATQMQQQAQAFIEAQAARQNAYEQAEGTESGSVAGDGSRWGAFKTNEAARDAKVDAKVADITNLQEAVAEGAVYDVSAKNPTAGPNNDGKWESLSALLSDANLNTLIPTSVRKGGMSIKFVQSSDNKYVQYRLTSQTFSTTESDWQGIDELAQTVVGTQYDVEALERAFDVTDIAGTAQFTDHKYVRYSDASIVLSAATTSIGMFTIPNDNYLSIKADLGSLDTYPASIAFYSSATVFNASTCIGKVQAVAGINSYVAQVPKGTKTILITNAYGRLSTPRIEVYKNFSTDILDDVLLWQRSEDATTSSISFDINVSSYPLGTKFKIVVDAVGGNNEARILLFDSTPTQYCSIRNVSVNTYYLEKTKSLDKIRLYKAAVSDNVFNSRVYLVKGNAFPSGSSQIGNYLVSNFNSSPISLKNPFQGYYNTRTWDDITVTRTWVTWQWEYSCGYKLKVHTDWTLYVVQVSFADLNLGYSNKTITSDTIIDLTDVLFWCVQIRRIDRADITPTDVANAVTVTVTEGAIKLRPGDANTLSILKKNVEQMQGEVYRKKTVPSVFSNSPCYYHFAVNGFIKDNGGHNAIASESLEDVEIAARLGFKFIEANVHETSDGNYVCIHGTSGAFGPECKSVDESVITTETLRTTAINSKTLSWIKTNVRYDSYYEKYQTTIPTLEEFCQACRKHGIGIFAGTNKRSAIEMCMKYLGDNVIIYNPPTDIRDYFGGYVYKWNNGSNITPSTLLADARKYGTPYMCGMDSSVIDDFIDDNILDGFIENMHNDGFLVGWAGVYSTEEQGRLYAENGLDFNGSGHEVNPFEPNYEVFDIDTENLPTTTGTIANGVISLANGDTITCGTSTKILGKGWLSIRFNGTLTINFGYKGNLQRTIASDGSKNIVISDYFFMRGTSLTITAGSATTVTSFVYKTSKC